MTEKTKTTTAVVDRRRTPALGDRKVSLRLREPDFIPPFDKVTSVSVVGFTKEGDFVGTEDKRGVDLSGGHVAEEDVDMYATGGREGVEEAGAHFDKLLFVRAIESDFYGTAPEDLTYMVILAGLVTKLDDEVLEGKRVIMSPENFKRKHVALESIMMSTLVDEAKALVFSNKR